METFIKEKTQEISFAVLRISAYIRRFDLRKKLEELAYHLLENVYYGNREMALKTIEVLEGFLRLAKHAYELEPVNHQILTKELNLLSSGLKKHYGLSDNQVLTGIFKVKTEESKEITKPRRINPANNAAKNTAIDNAAINPASENTANVVAVLPDSNKEQIILSGVRQERIMEYFRRGDKKEQRFKDISAAFPDISERTLRNDLSYLCDQGRLVREGSGGPANHYILPV